MQRILVKRGAAVQVSPRMIAVAFAFLFLSMVCVGAYGATLEETLGTVSQFSADLQQGRFEEAHRALHPEIRPLLPLEQLEAAWSSLPGQLGELQTVEEPYLVDEQQLLIRQPVHFANASIDLLFRLLPDLSIVEFRFAPYVPKSTLLAAGNGPPYADPTRFTEISLTFGVPEYPLEGTLTLPSGVGPFPTVVLVHGSGPNDRDETIGPNKPFRDLAWGLASRGIAVFRYDKRTLVHGQKMSLPEITVENEVLVDAVLALELVAEQEAVDSRRVYVLGHSLGGSLLPFIIEEASGVAGAISMAGAARSIDELILEQVIYLSGLDGEISAQEQAQIDAIGADRELICQGTIPDGAVVLGGTGRYWSFFQDFAPAQKVASQEVPYLFLRGGRDYQVTDTDWQLWREALGERVCMIYYDQLNHLFFAGSGPPQPAEYLTPGHVDPQVIEDIAAWILQAK